MTERRYPDREIYRRLLLHARPYWARIAGLFALGLLATPLTLLSPVPLKLVIDSVVEDHPVPGFLAAPLPASWTGSPVAVLGVAVALVVLIALASQIQALASSYLETSTGEKLVLSFRSRLFDHIQRFSLLYHDTKGTYDTTYRILYDAPAIQWISIHGVLPFLSAGVMLLAMLYVIARLDPTLALVALIVSPVLLALTFLWRPRLRSQWTIAKQRESSAVSVVQEVLGAVRVVKAFGQEDREHARFVEHAHEGVRARVRAMLSEQVFGFLVALVLAGGTATVLFIGTRHVLAGTLTLGSMVLVMSYLAQLYGPLKTLSGTLARVQNSLAGAERALALLDQSPDVVEREDAVPLRRARGHVKLEDVSFSYEPGAPILKDISFEVPPGHRVGIAGPTGSGKTTLVSLLTRFYDPDEGRVILDGVDLREYRVADLRDQFAMVLQEPLLFSTSIAENIAYARPDASEEEIVEAARAANAHEFITGTADGYRTLVGERGMRLSGGERQRISLARAFLKDAPILILDEPTSSVDLETEALIMDAMERLMGGRTSFMIAHRPSTLKSSDLLLVIERGRLAAAAETRESVEALLS